MQQRMQPAPPADETDVRERRARRAAERQSLLVMKSRRRNPNAVDYGAYWIVDGYTNGIVYGWNNGVSLDQIEAWLAAE